jgi:hypothetical protein
MEKGKQLPRVIGIFAPLCRHYSIAYNDKHPC